VIMDMALEDMALEDMALDEIILSNIKTPVSIKLPAFKYCVRLRLHNSYFFRLID